MGSYRFFLPADPNVEGASRERTASLSYWRYQVQTFLNHPSFGKAGFRKADIQLAYRFRKM